MFIKKQNRPSALSCSFSRDVLPEDREGEGLPSTGKSHLDYESGLFPPSFLPSWYSFINKVRGGVCLTLNVMIYFHSPAPTSIRT